MAKSDHRINDAWEGHAPPLCVAFTGSKIFAPYTYIGRYLKCSFSVSISPVLGGLPCSKPHTTCLMQLCGGPHWIHIMVPGGVPCGIKAEKRSTLHGVHGEWGDTAATMLDSKSPLGFLLAKTLLYVIISATMVKPSCAITVEKSWASNRTTPVGIRLIGLGLKSHYVRVCIQTARTTRGVSPLANVRSSRTTTKWRVGRRLCMHPLVSS